MTNGYCLYAIAERESISRTYVDCLGVDGKHKLEVVTADHVAGFVSQVSLNDFGCDALKSNMHDLSWLEPKVRSYDLLIRALSETYTIVPVRFGTIYYSKDNLLRMLSSNAKQLLCNLSSLRGMWELGLTVIFDRDKLGAEVQEHSPELRALSEKMPHVGPGAAYLLQRKMESSLSAIVDTLIAQKLNGILTDVKAFGLTAHQTPLTVSSENSNLCQWKVACLVRQSEWESIKQSILSLDELTNTKGIAVRISGPWPPYSFASWGDQCLGQQEELHHAS